MNNFEPPTFASTHGAAASIDDGDLEWPGDHDPAPRYRGDDIWSHWKMVDKAYKTVNESQTLLAELETILKAKVEEAEKLKEKSSKIFEGTRQKTHVRLPSTLKLLQSKPVSNLATDLASAREQFELALKEENAVKEEIDELTAKINSLKENITHNIGLASTIDQVFELLGASVATLPPEYEMLPGREEKLAAASASYNETEKVVSDLTRARVTVQHAHHYYETVLKTIDSVRGTPLSRALLGGLGEVSKQRDYGVAVDTASKAQICFNDTVRVLTPHITMIPPSVLEDFEELKKTGLLQASKIYNLMYGWSNRTTGITKAVEAMLRRQEEIFVRLTRLAVWVQDAVPMGEVQLRSSRETRDQSRRELALSWHRRRQVLDIGSEY